MCQSKILMTIEMVTTLSLQHQPPPSGRVYPMLHCHLATASLVQLFANPGKASRKSSLELQQLEAQMQHTQLLHKKSLTDRQQTMQSLTTGIETKTKLNKHLQKQIMDLAELLDDQVPAIEAMSAKQDTSRSAPALPHSLPPQV